MNGMDVHLVDGTYELFRHFYAMPSGADVDGNEVGAVRVVLTSIVGLIEGGATHIGVATDHVIESFRNELYPGYKTGDGIEPHARAVSGVGTGAPCMGVMVWPMVPYEADDALASAAAKAALDPEVGRVNDLHSGQRSRAMRGGRTGRATRSDARDSSR